MRLVRICGLVGAVEDSVRKSQNEILTKMPRKMAIGKRNEGFHVTGAFG